MRPATQQRVFKQAKAILVLLGVLPLTPLAYALGEKQIVGFAPSASSFPIAQAQHATPLYVDAADWPGVSRAATTFAGDIHSVTGTQPIILHQPQGDLLILAGTIGRSAAIDRLIASHQLDVSKVRGQWEASLTQVVDHPFPGVRRALVLAGADKRGTIFALYHLSEQMGVSPWAWWADVPIHHHDALFIDPAPFVETSPHIRYRGIFLNDEAPALSGWTREKFGGINHLFYEHVFELLLRLRANFLWPAMWNNAFNEDDPADPRIADEYGIVMGTSHHEPMMRAQQEWKRHGTGPWDYSTNQQVLDDFWRAGVRRNKDYEELTTIGMRGDGDMAMSASTNTALLERIVSDQRKILAQEVNPDVTRIPQVWALYKEVQGYYEAGMRVPDDVTLLWCDDNWGNLRRLPTAAERARPGGAGIYYHFDYVGGPRNYKWLNTNSIYKVQEQMNLAVEYGADRLWIVNVGDLKPMEFPIDFFLNYARRPERWSKDHVEEFTQLWAAREFGPEHAADIANMVDLYTRYNSRRKPEQLDPDTFSFTEDHEADRVEQAWQALVARAQALNTQLPEDQRAAFFELVLHPIRASAIVSEMYIAAGRNHLYARQGRASANHFADQTRRLFAADAALTDEYNHTLLNGKWDHMMDQTHIGYTSWQEPPLNAMPAVQQVDPLPYAAMSVFPEGASGLNHTLAAFDSVNRQTRTIDLANRGTQPFHFTALASQPWIQLSATAGDVAADQTLTVTLDWPHVPEGESIAAITFTQPGQTPVKVEVHATRATPAQHLAGYVENNGKLAIEAVHPSARTAAHGISWQELPGYGNTLAAMEAFPVTAAPSDTPEACLAYTFTLWHAGDWHLESVLGPTLAFAPGRGLRYSIAVDAAPPKTVDAWASGSNPDSNPAWGKVVSDNANRVPSDLGPLTAGPHILRFCRIDPGELWQDRSAPSTYLGPPESAFALPGAP